MTKSQAGQMGGRQTVRRHGIKHMREIGKKGARKFWKLYSLKPVGLAHFAIVRRLDGVIIGHTSWR
jgi:hypothetical protein